MSADGLWSPRLLCGRRALGVCVWWVGGEALANYNLHVPTEGDLEIL
jgi:hypothetical protein